MKTPHPARTSALADSVILGGIACSLSIVSFVVLVLVVRGILELDDIGTLSYFSLSGLPIAIAFLNLIFVVRDRQIGRRRAATAGALLSGASVFIVLAPLALVPG